MNKILTEHGLVDEGLWDRIKNFVKQPVQQQPVQQKQQQGQQQSQQILNDLSSQLKIPQQQLMQMIQSGKIKGVSPQVIQQLQKVLKGSSTQQVSPQQAQQAQPGQAPPVIGQQQTQQTPQSTGAASPSATGQQPSISQKTQQSIPVKGPNDQFGDPFAASRYQTQRIGTNQPEIKMASELPLSKGSNLQMAQNQQQGLRMVPQTPLPQQTQQTTQPQAQQPAAQQPRQVTPTGAAASRWSKKYVPRGRVGTYNLEETLSKNQLKTLVKEVVKILEKL